MKNVENKNLKCNNCDKKAIIELEYGPHKFCKEHYIEFFEKRIRKTIRIHKLIKPREKIAISLSGGKDSTVLLWNVWNIFKNTNEIEAIIVDEGIEGYRDKSANIAIKNCEKLGIKYYLIKFSENGNTMDEIVKEIQGKNMGTPCSYCGIIRRKIVNKKAKEIKANKLATGHNQDDEVQSIVMNVFDANIKQYIRIGPKTDETKGLVMRIKPLSETPEEEIKYYAELMKIEHYPKRCPYSGEAKRNEYRRMVEEFEKRFPGTKYSIQKFFNTTKPIVKEKYKQEKIQICKQCGEPSSRELCRSCEKQNKLQKEIKK